MKQTITLAKPMTIKGAETATVELNFDALTGRDLSDAETTVRSAGEMTPMLTFSGKYQAAVAAKLLGVKYDDVLDLPASDYTKLTTAVMGFLTGQA